MSQVPSTVDWDLLDVLTGEERQRLLAAMRRRQFARAEIVFHEGDPASSVHVLESGHVAVRVSTPDGDSVTLAVLGAGQTFGELALLGRGKDRRAATVIALDRCATLSLSRERFDALREQYPRLDRLLAEILADEVRRLDARLLEMLYLSVDKRVLRRLIMLTRAYADGGRLPVVIPLTQDVIAGLAGASRPTTNQALRAAEDAGLITIQRSRIEVLDPAGLVSRAR